MPNPFSSAMQHLDEAAALSRRRDSANAVPDGYAKRRYEVLRSQPVLLDRFVREATGVQDPQKIQAAARAYLTEMERRYGTGDTGRTG